VPVTASLNPFTAEAIEDPYPVHDALRRNGISYVEETDTWVASRYSDVETILFDTDNFTARNAAGGGDRLSDPEFGAIYSEGWPMARTLMTADPPNHRWYRMVLSKRFAPRSVAALEQDINDIVHELIDGIFDDRQADVIKELALPIPLIVFCRQIGVPPGELPLIKHFTNDLNDSFTFEVANLGRDRELELARSTVQFQHYAWAMIQERRKNSGDDLLSMMIRTKIPGLGDRPMTDVEILSTVMLLLNAGTETTMNLLGNAVALLLHHPDQLAKLRADRSLIPLAVDEILRYESPVQCLFRNAKRDVVVGGVTIPAQARVAVLYGAANRDPDFWTAPHVFDVTRPEASRGLYFGKGEHFCLGAHLARLEARISLNAVLDRLPNLRLAPGINDFRHRQNPLTRGLVQLQVEWDLPT
jgi:cytochrome P450